MGISQGSICTWDHQTGGWGGRFDPNKDRKLREKEGNLQRGGKDGRRNIELRDRIKWMRGELQRRRVKYRLKDGGEGQKNPLQLWERESRGPDPDPDSQICWG